MYVSMFLKVSYMGYFPTYTNKREKPYDIMKQKLLKSTYCNTSFLTVSQILSHLVLFIHL